MLKILGRKLNGIEIFGKKFLKILVFFVSLLVFFVVLFVIENFWNLGLEFYVKWELFISI